MKSHEESVLKFLRITIREVEYPHAWGELYHKPTPTTVLARITFHFKHDHPYLTKGSRFRLTALCANDKWMRNIVADVVKVDAVMQKGTIVELVLHRKGASY